jgi:hypothetical protein
MGLNEFAKLDKNRRLKVLADPICEKAIREALADAKPNFREYSPLNLSPSPRAEECRSIDETIQHNASSASITTLLDYVSYCVHRGGDLAPPSKIYRKEREREGILEELERIQSEYSEKKSQHE